MPLDDLQFSYRGLTFGEGTEYHVNRAEGFEGFEVRTSDSDQPRGDGAIRGLDYAAPRTVAFELAVIETTSAGGVDYEAAWAAVRAAFRPSREDDYPLTFKRPGAPERLIRCRPVQLVRVEEFKRYNTVGFPPVVLRAVDPRIYSAAEQNQNVPVYAASAGGVEYALEYPFDFTGGTQSELAVTNEGTGDAYPLIRFYGPTSGTCSGVTLTNTTNGDVLDIATTISGGQILQADMEAAVTGGNRLVISLDGSSRYGSWTLPRAPFALAPGSNTLRFQVTGSATNVVCGLTWRHTWMD